jgi:flavorubredoxin
MVRALDIESIVPQHGRSFIGKPMVNQFISWVENLECGMDLMTQANYKIP